MKKYIFLDFNGTILNDVDLCLNLLNEMLIDKEKKPLNIIEYKNVFTFPIKTYYEKAGFDFVGYTYEELADYFVVEYGRRNVTEAFIYHDFIEFINTLRALEYKIILCSASMKTMLLEQLKHFKIDDVFDDVIALSDHFAISKLELTKEYVKNHEIDLSTSYFIGDTTHDAEVGKECGLNVILVERGHQSYDVLKTQNTLIAKDYSEVLKYLK